MRFAMKKWHIVVFLLVITSILTFSRSKKIESEKNLLNNALKYFQRHSYKKALSNADKLIKYYPKSKYITQIKVIKGLSLTKLKRYKEGIAYLEKLIKKNKHLNNEADLMKFLGQAYYNWNSYSYANKTINYYKKAISLYSKDNNIKEIVNIYHDLIKSYERKNYSQEFPSDWRKQVNAKNMDVISCYDAIIQIAKNEGTKVTALYNKAVYIHTRLYYNPKKKKLSIKAYQDVIKRYPDHSLAAQSQFRLAGLYNQYGNYIKAISEYQKFIKNYPNHYQIKDAKNILASIKAPSISLQVYSVAKPGEMTKLNWQTRNVKKISLSAYKVDLFKVLKKIERLHEIDEYSIKGQKPVKKWQFQPPDKGVHKFHHSDGKNRPYIEVPVTDSGAYIIKGYGENPEKKGYEVTTLIIVSKLGLITKSGKEKSIFYTVNSLTGNPIEKTKLLIQKFISSSWDYTQKKYHYKYSYHDKQTGQSGLASFNWDQQKNRNYNRNLFVIARSGDDYAVSGTYFYYYWYGYRRNFKVYGYTDRPVYRPNQLVNFKQIVRKYKYGEYVNYSDQDVHVLITDPKGNKLFNKTLKTNEFGTISDSFKLGKKPPLGVYYIQITVANESYSYWQSSGNRFRVEEYKKPEYKVTVTTKKPTYKIGDKINFKILSKYYFGSPVSNADVQYTIYKSQYYNYYRPYRRYGWFYNDDFYNKWASRGYGYYYPHYYHRRELVTSGKSKSDKNGEISVTIQSEHFKNAGYADVKYIVEAKVVDKSRREIRGYGEVKVTNKAFYVYLNPLRYLYEKGEKIKIKVSSKNPNDQPVSFSGEMKVYPLKYVKGQNNNWLEKTGQEVFSKKIFVSSRGENILSFSLKQEGYFKVIITTKDDRGEKITGSCNLWIAKEKNEFDHYRYKDIELVVDKDTYIIGDTAKVLINTKHENSYVLLTAEADDVYFNKVIYVQGKSKIIDMPITHKLTPNVWLTASTFKNNKLFRDSLEVIIPPEHKYLDVKIIASKTTFQPQETAEFTVIAKNYKGQGVKSEFSLGFVDSSIYYIQSEYRQDIRKFFYGQKRYLQVRTTTGFDYRHYGRGRSKKRKNGEKLADTDDEGAPESSEKASPKKTLAKKDDKKPAGGKTGKELKKPRVRKDFPDTMFWNAHVTTDKNGIAKIKVKFPDTLTTWKLSSTVISKDSEVGVYDLNVITRKNLIVRLQSPRFFQEKDLVYVSGIVHNYLDSDKNVLVKLNVTDQLGISHSITEGVSSQENYPLKQQLEKEIVVPKEGEKRVDFVIKVKGKGKGQKPMATVTISALTDEESDAMQLKFPVKEYGVEKFLAQNGILDMKKNASSANLLFNIPQEIKPGSQEIKVILNPSIASVMIDALPYLISYPYGCVEQTMSRFLPTVITQHTLKQLGISLEEIAQKHQNQFKYLKKSPIYKTSEMNKMVQAGLDRLYSFQHSDGGWGWWKNDRSNPYMTAYVVYGLSYAVKSDVKIRKSVINRGAGFIEKRLTSGAKISRYSWYKDDNNVRCYMLYVLSIASPKRFKQNKKLKRMLNKIWRKRDRLNEYSKVLLALTQAQIGNTRRAKIMLENLEDFIKVNKELKTANFQDINRYWYWYENGLESTAFALRAYLKIQPKSDYIPMMVKWLVRNRKGKRWFSTKDTANVVYALSEYMKATDELNPDLTVEVSYDDDFKKTFKVTRQNLIFNKPEFTIPYDIVGRGKRYLKINISGRGKIYYSTFAKYFTKEDPIKGAGHEVYVNRKYFKLTPREVTRYRKEWNSRKRKYSRIPYKDIAYTKKPIQFGARLNSGDLIEVVLNIKANNNFEYLMFEDPKPAGCEPVALKSGSTYQGGFAANMELRDTMVSFFVTYLKQGKHTISYKLRAEIPGTFNIMPSQSQAMYSPYVRGISDSWKMNITDKND